MDEYSSDQLISYIGNEPCACVVFNRQDEPLAVPLCLKLQRAGYRMQFTEEPHDTHPEYQNVCVFLFMVSEHFFTSHELRQMLNTAFLEKKNIILLLLDRMKMMPSFQMQIKSVQVFRYWEYDNEEILLSVLRAQPLLQSCLQSNKTVYYPKDNRYCQYYLVRRKTGERIVINHSGFKIGRQTDACDYSIEDNNTISRIHAVFELDLGLCIIRDNASTNRVYLNDIPLRENEEKVLKSGDLIEMGSEQFTVVVEDLNNE